MKITDAARLVTKLEGGKVNLSIAQVCEVLRCLNAVTRGRFYTWMRGL